MGINCPSCGGKMTFNIADQVLVCEFCDTRIAVKNYKSNNEAEEQKATYDSVVFTCRNCGAELTAPDEQTVAYCSYCGSEQMLTAKHEQLLRPKRIIPFKKSKEQAKEEYAKALKGKLYVPKEFKDSAFLEGFRGIYLPYYSYNAQISEKSLSLKGHKEYSSGNYDYSEDYDIYATVGGRTQDVTFDASSAFDDTLANEIAPFEAKGLEDFHEGYLAGLYADKATTTGGTYLEMAKELVADSVFTDIGKKIKSIKIDRAKSEEEEIRTLGIGAIDCDVSYFPVWFLTWRNKKRVAYSVMNGQTGKLAVDIPVNKGTFFLVSLIAAAVLFGLLSILPMFILPKLICVIAGILLLISSIVLRSEIKRIYERESHIYDYGDTLHTAKKKKLDPKLSADGPKKTKSGKKKSYAWIGWLIPLAYIAFYFLFYAGRGAMALVDILSGSYTVFFVILIPIQIVFSILTIIDASKIQRKTAIIPAIIAPAIVIAGIIIGAVNSPFDYWHYGVAIACLIAMIINGISCINYFNYLTTRPVPNFFRREGANNEK